MGVNENLENKTFFPVGRIFIIQTSLLFYAILHVALWYRCPIFALQIVLKADDKNF